MDNIPTKIIIKYSERFYEISFYNINPNSNFRKELEAGIYRALSLFHGDFVSINKRIFDIKALINNYLAESGHPWPEQLTEALKI